MFKIIYFQCGSFILKVTKWANTNHSSSTPKRLVADDKFQNGLVLASVP